MSGCRPRSRTFRSCDRDRRVAVDQLGEHSAQRFDAQRKRRHVQQQHVLYFAAQHAPCTAAPTATTSSGFTVRLGLPNKFLTISKTGMESNRPPALLHRYRRLQSGIGERLLQGSWCAQECRPPVPGARGSLYGQVLGAAGIRVRNGRLISVSSSEDNLSWLSPASFRRCRPSGLETSMPDRA